MEAAALPPNQLTPPADDGAERLLTKLREPLYLPPKAKYDGMKEFVHVQFDGGA